MSGLTGNVKGYRPIPLVTLHRPASTMVTQSQPINYSQVASNFAAITRTQLPRTEAPKYQQPYDNMNILEQYHGRTLEIETEVFTAEVMNDRAMPTLAVLAPIMPMTERHISWTKREHYMLPFDIAAIGGVPRRTFHHKTEDHASLRHYIRFASMEINYLLDVNFGRQMLDETLAVIVAQARLTLTFQFSWGVVKAALEQTYNSFAASTRSAQYIYTQSAFFALGNSNPDDLVLKITQLREPNRKFTHLLVVEQMGRHLREVVTESRTVEGYHYGYDTETERLVLAVYNAMEGVPSIPTTDGGYMAVLENVALRYSNVGAERMKPTQTLEGFATLCEVVLQPDIHPDDDSIDDPTGLRDPVSYDQTETSIEHKPFLFADALSACGIWNNWEDGTVAGPGSFGDAYTDLLKAYNASGKPGLKEKFQDPNFRGNNTPGSADWNRTSLSEMDCRDGFPFMTLSKDKRTFKEAVYIGSLPEVAWPKAHAERTVRILRKHYQKWANGAADMTVNDFMDLILPDSAVGATKKEFSPSSSSSSTSSKGKEKETSFTSQWNAIVREFEDVGLNLLEILKKSSTIEAEKIDNTPLQELVKTMQELYRRNQIKDDFDQIKAIKPFDGTKETAELNSNRLLAKIRMYRENVAKLANPYKEMDKTGEPSKLADVMKKSVEVLDDLSSVEETAESLVEDVRGTDLSDKTFWAMHIPDSHVARFSAAFALMQKEKATSEDKEGVKRGFDAVLAALRKTSGYASSRVVINDLASHMERGDSVTDFGNGKVELVTMRAMSQNRPLPSHEMSAATRARQSLNNESDAMDIDGDGDYTFGVLPTKRTVGIGGDYNEYPILVRRLKNSQFKDQHEQDIFYRLMTAHFSLDNCYSLSKRYGLQLFKFNYWRPWQRYRMYHMIAMIPGPGTAVTGFSQPIVCPSMQGMEGYINIVGQFWSAFIVTQPENIRLIPNVITAGLLTTINTEFVRTRDDWKSDSPIKPSTVVEVAPLDETKYNWPLHMLEKQTLAPGDLNENSPYLRHRGKDLLVQIAGGSFLNDHWSMALDSDSMAPLPMSLVGHRSWYMHMDKRLGRYNIFPGTSPRGKSLHNGVEAAEVWAGGAVRFTITPHFTVPVVA
jgi:hypothetical protein